MKYIYILLFLIISLSSFKFTIQMDFLLRGSITFTKIFEGKAFEIILTLQSTHIKAQHEGNYVYPLHEPYITFLCEYEETDFPFYKLEPYGIHRLENSNVLKFQVKYYLCDNSLINCYHTYGPNNILISFKVVYDGGEKINEEPIDINLLKPPRNKKLLHDKKTVGYDLDSLRFIIASRRKGYFERLFEMEDEEMGRVKLSELVDLTKSLSVELFPIDSTDDILTKLYFIGSSIKNPNIIIADFLNYKPENDSPDSNIKNTEVVNFLKNFGKDLNSWLGRIKESSLEGAQKFFPSLKSSNPGVVVENTLLFTRKAFNIYLSPLLTLMVLS
jgi:hypothetical protein